MATEIWTKYGVSLCRNKSVMTHLRTEVPNIFLYVLMDTSYDRKGWGLSTLNTLIMNELNVLEYKNFKYPLQELSK